MIEEQSKHKQAPKVSFARDIRHCFALSIFRT
jgi:hypothetical protein